MDGYEFVILQAKKDGAFGPLKYGAGTFVPAWISEQVNETTVLFGSEPVEGTKPQRLSDKDWNILARGKP